MAGRAGGEAQHNQGNEIRKRRGAKGIGTSRWRPVRGPQEEVADLVQGRCRKNICATIACDFPGVESVRMIN